MRLEENYYLHDAVVVGIGQTANLFVLILKLDTPPRSLLVFRYTLTSEPTIDQDSLPEVARLRGEPTWQYNELELVSTEPIVWRESLLLSNGWELTLTFRDIEVEEISAILPAPRSVAHLTTPRPLEAQRSA